MIIDSRDPYDLEPHTFAIYKLWQEKCAAAGYDVRMISGYRNIERQNQIYNTVDKNGHRATGARGGQSFHQYRVAWDFAIYKAGGKIDWYDAKGYELCGKIGEQLGCFWGGHWTSLGDNGHLQSVSCSSIASSGLPKKYPSGERPKDWSKADCDQAYLDLVSSMKYTSAPVKVGVDKPRQSPAKSPAAKLNPEPLKGDYSHVSDPIPEAEKPTVAGFLGFLFNKLKGGSGGK